MTATFSTKNSYQQKCTSILFVEHLLISLPHISLFGLISLGCLYKYMTAFPMPLVFNKSVVSGGNCNRTTYSVH